MSDEPKEGLTGDLDPGEVIRVSIRVKAPADHPWDLAIEGDYQVHLNGTPIVLAFQSVEALHAFAHKAVQEIMVRLAKAWSEQSKTVGVIPSTPDLDTVVEADLTDLPETAKN